MNNPALLKELKEISKIQKACADKHCKKESNAVQKLMKDLQKKMDAVSKKVQTGMIQFQTGKMNQQDYINMIKQEVKNGFKEIYNFMHSKEVHASATCIIKMCNPEFRKTLHAITKFLETLCKQSALGPFKFLCDAEKELAKLEKQETITVDAYIKILVNMLEKAEKVMVK